MSPTNMHNGNASAVAHLMALMAEVTFASKEVSRHKWRWPETGGRHADPSSHRQTRARTRLFKIRAVVALFFINFILSALSLIGFHNIGILTPYGGYRAPMTIEKLFYGKCRHYCHWGLGE